MTTATANLPEIDTNRDAVILRIRKALKSRSGKAWSVKGGRGTGWGWIDISLPPSRTPEFGGMPEADRAELSALLGGVSVSSSGVMIPASTNYRIEFVDRAEGRNPRVKGEPYWD